MRRGDFMMPRGHGHLPILVLNIEMGRPPNSELKYMLKYTMGRYHGIMGRSRNEVAKINIEKSTNITFGATL